jgi:PAS domain S-box-containing protein
MLLLATDAAAIGTWDFNPLTGELRWDAQCKALFGLPPNALVDYDVFLKGLHSDDRDRTDAAVQAALSPDGRGAYDVEYRTIGIVDGTERWVSATGRGFFQDGRAVRFVGTIHDITAQKNAERVLRQSETQFRTMAQAMPNHVWTAGPDGLLDWLNDQIPAYSGVAMPALLGAGWASIVHPDDLPGAGAQWGAALECGRTCQTEFRLRRVDGTFRWHIARAVPVRGEGGQVVRWIGTNTDIDDQKNAEVLLEKRLQERTVALVRAEQALQQAQKMEAIGNLTGGIAHDFNNLLMAVTGSLELLKKRLPVDPMVARLIDNAMEGARRGASLTKRMLAFARRQPLQPERLDLSQLVGGMTELLERSLGPMLMVETRFPMGLPLVETDPNQLESALLNLVVNARDAMAGAGRIVITARAQTLSPDLAMEGALKPGDYVCLCVTDTGEGMDTETLKRATEPFFTTKGVGKGTGLGLSMVHGLAEQSGGALRLYSQQGKGTTAEIWLPALTRGAVAASARPASAPLAPAAAMTILAVDDDVLVLMNTVDMLEDMGHRVASAGSGLEALRLLEEGMAFDLVITDHAMPQMTGAQLAQEIARRRPEMKVLLATGYAELPKDADAGLPLLSKPFTQAELAAALARLTQ